MSNKTQGHKFVGMSVSRIFSLTFCQQLDKAARLTAKKKREEVSAKLKVRDRRWGFVRRGAVPTEIITFLQTSGVVVVRLGGWGGGDAYVRQ